MIKKIFFKTNYFKTFATVKSISNQEYNYKGGQNEYIIYSKEYKSI